MAKGDTVTFYSRIRKHTLVAPCGTIRFEPDDLRLDLPDGEKRVYPRGVYRTDDSAQIKAIRGCSDYDLMITETDPYANIVKSKNQTQTEK